MSVCAAAVDSIRKVVTSSIGNIEISRQKSQQNALSLYLLVQVWAAGVCVYVFVSVGYVQATTIITAQTYTHTYTNARVYVHGKPKFGQWFNH